jgi:SAM-dependent methyltransferase
MSQSVESFYNEFAAQFVKDVVEGNDRVTRQLEFLSREIPRTTESVLIIGAGSGQSAAFVSKLVPKASVLGVDLSDTALNIGRKLFQSPQITLRRLDVIKDPLEGEFEIIVLPDVYEHIPLESRPVLHARMNRLLADRGKVLITIPSPAKQEAEARWGGLQIIDETVTLEDLMRIAKDVGGMLAYFDLVSIYHTNDYIHAVIERGFEQMTQPPTPQKSLVSKALSLIEERTGIRKRWLSIKKRQLEQTLRGK